MDGYITIGTKLDTKDLEGELKSLKNDLAQYEKENKMLLKQKAKLELDTSEAEKKIQETSDMLEQIAIKQNALELQRENAPKYSESYFEAIEQLNVLQAEETKYNKQHADTLDLIQKQETALGDINSKIRENITKQENLKTKISNVNEEMRQQSLLSGISKGLQNILIKVTKWGLMLFGIRTAYSMISNTISAVSQQDDVFAAKIEYIKYALSNILAPVVKWIVERVYDLLSLLGGVIKFITGINIFANATADSFFKMKKGIDKTRSSAQKLQKTLAGFDEMNVLNDSGSGGALGGFKADISDLRDLTAEVDTMGEKIRRWFFGGDSLKEGLRNFIQTFQSEWLPNIQKVFSTGAELANQYFISPIIEASRPIWEPIYKEGKKIVNEKLKPMWEDFYDKTLKPIGKKTGESFKEAYERSGLYEVIVKPIAKAINDIMSWIAPTMNKIIDWINYVFGPFDVHLKHIEGDFIKIGTATDKENLKLTEMGKGLSKAESKAQDITNGKFKMNIDTTNVSNANTWLDNIWTDLKNLTSKTWKIVTSFTSNGVSSNTANSWLDPIRNALSKIGITIPKLAKGTILNNPGRGVPIGGAIAGEAGREAYLPLSDSQLLEELGSTIGRYITINLTNETNLDGRTIARKVSQLSNNDNFLRNR